MSTNNGFRPGDVCTMWHNGGHCEVIYWDRCEHSGRNIVIMMAPDGTEYPYFTSSPLVWAHNNVQLPYWATSTRAGRIANFLPRRSLKEVYA